MREKLTTGIAGCFSAHFVGLMVGIMLVVDVYSGMLSCLEVEVEGLLYT